LEALKVPKWRGNDRGGCVWWGRGSSKGKKKEKENVLCVVLW